MEKHLLHTSPIIFSGDEVIVTEMGNIVEVQYMSHLNSSSPIVKLDKDHYIDKRDLAFHDGEIVDYCIQEINHIENRSQSLNSFSQSFKRLRELINANVDVKHIENYLWLTVTFKENITDNKIFSNCFDVFWKRFRRYCESHSFDVPKYICTVEPQGRGSWHGHILLLWDHAAPFIPNNEVFEKLWEWGFTRINSLYGIDNIGAYLSAYLTDMDISEIEDLDVDTSFGSEVKEIQGEECNKKIIKGARLHLYPPGMKLYRCSQNLIQPVKTHCSYSEALSYVDDLGLTLSYEKNIFISDDTKEFSSVVSTRQYKKYTRDDLIK